MMQIDVFRVYGWEGRRSGYADYGFSFHVKHYLFLGASVYCSGKEYFLRI